MRGMVFGPGYAAMGQGRSQSDGIRSSAWLRWAGIIYLAAWIAWLVVFSPPSEVRPTGQAILDEQTGHRLAAAMHVILTQAVAGCALAVVVWQLVRRSGAGRRGRRVMVLAGVVAVTFSFARTVLGLLVTGVAVPEGRADLARDLTLASNMADGVKMLALAVIAATVGLWIRRGHLASPSWLGIAGFGTAAALIVSGIGYVSLFDPLALAAWVSLPLLLVVVTGVALTAGRSRRQEPGASPGAASM